MKKLLLFILILFGILSTQSFAGGCNAKICMCPNGGWVTFGQYCPVNDVYTKPEYTSGKYYLFIMPSLDSKNYQLIDLNTRDDLVARDIIFGRFAYLYEENSNIKIKVRVDSKTSVSWVSSEDGRLFYCSVSDNAAKKNCKESGGKNCKIILKLNGSNLKLKDFRDNTTIQLKVTSLFSL